MMVREADQADQVRQGTEARLRADVPAVASTELPLPRIGQGKVRDLYDAGEARLLMVATDRISAFDVVLSPAIPWKGIVLTQITEWWLGRLSEVGAHHLITTDPARIVQLLPELEGSQSVWAHRSMLVHRTEPIPIECVVRGYLAGSAWKEYRERGTLAGEPLPEGLVESARLEPAIFSPATKAASGHDENIPFGRARERLGDALASELRRRSIALYEEGRSVADGCGIIIADTKFELGTRDNGELLLIDEVLTPDSSRFWPEESYRPGRGQPSLDKQPVRDWLEARCEAGEWDKTAPAPALPPEVVEATSQRYREVFRRLTGTQIEVHIERRRAEEQEE